MKQAIEKFKSDDAIAIVGISKKKKDAWANDLVKEFNKVNIEVLPIHPSVTELDGTTCYKSPADLPPEVENVILAIKPQSAFEFVKTLENTNIKRVWFHKGLGRGSGSEEAIDWCKEHHIEVVHGVCPMMYFGTGMHKFHFKMKKFFRTLPKELR